MKPLKIGTIEPGLWVKLDFQLWKTIMKSKTIMEMKHRNLILEKKIKKNIDEMKLLVKMYEMTWKTMEDDEPPEDVKREYLEDEEN